MLEQFLKELADMQITLNTYSDEDGFHLIMTRQEKASTFALKTTTSPVSLKYSGALERDAMKAVRTFRNNLKQAHQLDADFEERAR